MLKLVRRLNMSTKLYSTKKGLTMMNFIEIAKNGILYAITAAKGRKREA